MAGCVLEVASIIR